MVPPDKHLRPWPCPISWVLSLQEAMQQNPWFPVQLVLCQEKSWRGGWLPRSQEKYGKRDRRSLPRQAALVEIQGLVSATEISYSR